MRNGCFDPILCSMNTNKHAWISVANKHGKFVVRHANVDGMGPVQENTIEDLIVSAAQRVAGTHPAMEDLEIRMPRGRGNTIISLRPAA